jgi:hypothetical protein
MKNKFLPQEWLKLIACVTMLLDHIGAVIYPSVGLRIIGRISFPIFCFLLTEGIAHTRSPKKYLCRLACAAVLSELPFDLLFFGRLTLQHQNVMLTLLLGGAMLLLIQHSRRPLLTPVWAALACVLAYLLQTDYGYEGILLILLFSLTGSLPVRLIGILLLYFSSGFVAILGLPVPIGLFAALSLVPICLYSEKKQTSSKWIQRGFYLFYPAHMLLLLLIKIFP